ncbi:hypothetical protein M501DRAFT_603678 [Patellaria atrata CBS 101060]|uniref:Uncharacterized protein n=1 Tax=Patellaria atrata CBS 101060 TaxID=1346257 RepID=A0A9P4VM22_9PEZI|nr:hypothetical protein M501DRAFT_603678 [Patellaria atrata CBS 101060]
MHIKDLAQSYGGNRTYYFATTLVCCLISTIIVQTRLHIITLPSMMWNQSSSRRIGRCIVTQGIESQKLYVNEYVLNESRTRVDHSQFRLDAIRTDEIILDSAIKTWICELTNRFAVTGQIFEFTNWPILIAADANMIRLMGWSYSQIPSGYEEALNLIKTMQGGVKAMHTLGRLPSLKKFLFRGPLKWLLTPNVGDTTPLGRMLRFRDDLIAERIQNPEPYC